MQLYSVTLHYLLKLSLVCTYSMFMHPCTQPHVDVEPRHASVCSFVRRDSSIETTEELGGESGAFDDELLLANEAVNMATIDSRSQSIAATSPAYRPTSPAYYSPASQTYYSATSPTYSPTSPARSGVSPTHSPPLPATLSLDSLHSEGDVYYMIDRQLSSDEMEDAYPFQGIKMCMVSDDVYGDGSSQEGLDLLSGYLDLEDKLTVKSGAAFTCTLGV